MKKSVIFISAVFFILASCDSFFNNSKTVTNFKKIRVQYPKTFRDTTVIDNYFGKLVADPYRWLEDDNSENTKRWVKTQNRVTFDYLDQIPYRKAIEKRLTELWNYERYSTPFKKGGKYYFFKNDGLQNQSILYEQETLRAAPKLVLDPNKFSADGTTSLAGYAFSKDGSLLAYQVSEGGSDWRTIHLKDLKTGKLLDDAIHWVKFSAIAWASDGFYYCRYPAQEDGNELSAKNEFHQVFFHRVGTSQIEDKLVFADHSNPMHGFAAQTTEDERFLLLSVWKSTSGNAIYFKDLHSKKAQFVPIEEEIKDDYSLVDNVGSKLLLLTNNRAPNNRLIIVNTAKPGRDFWEEIIPESSDVLQRVQLIGGKLAATFLHNASSRVKIYNLDGSYQADLALPEKIGTIGAFEGEKDSPEAFYSFTSFKRPPTIYRLDLNSLQSSKFKEPEILFEPDKYETNQVWYESYDKTKVPMFITHKKGLKMDGKRPTLLYGYGGFDISILPRFQVSRAVILENGGIYAVANIRGGGEFGTKWHMAGTKERKQNVFNDFQAAAEFLIEKAYTSKEKLAIEGRSNGGLLIGACITQRPDLYQVAFPGVGVLDMLRYHKFTIGAAWAVDYGRSDNPKDFDYLIAYSPVHNVEPAEYPATLVTTADHDDRVVPAHSFKFISELQANQKGGNPVLIRVETSAGHGGGKPVSKQIEESADMLAFMFYNMKENVVYEYQVEN